MKARVNSVISLSAQIKNVCQPVSIIESQVSELVEVLNLNRSYLGIYYYVFMLQESSGCRVTEILQVRYQDITSGGDIYIRGLKGSENRLIASGVAGRLISKSRSLRLDPFTRCNRYTAYRLLKNIGIGRVKKGRKHVSVTHIFRDNYVKRMRELEMTDRERSRQIGHKSTQSTEHYGKD